MDNAATVIAALLGLVGLAAAATRKASAPSSPSGASTSQIQRLTQAFAAAGVSDFSPEEFLLLRKWGQLAEMPEEYEPNLVALAVQAQALRDRLGLPVAVRNGYRSPAYNAAVSGAPNSAHLRGAAGDFEVVSAAKTAESGQRREDRRIGPADSSGGRQAVAFTPERACGARRLSGRPRAP